MSVLGAFALIALLLFLRLNLIVILLVVAAYIHIVFGDGKLQYIIEDMWVGADKEVLLSIPLFILCGAVMTRGSIAERLIRIMIALTSPLPGGLAVATILSCAVFAAISGSSIVTLLAVGAVMYPALIKQGYSVQFALGAICSGGTLGIIIPPSIPMIIYGIITETSITDLFIAGVLPGLLLTALFAAYSLWSNRARERSPWEFAEISGALGRGIFAAMMPVILLGGIYTGYFTATESAAVALGYALLVEIFIHRELNLKDYGAIVLETTKTLGTLFPVLAIALSLNLLLTAQRVPNIVADWMVVHVGNDVAFLIGTNILLLIVGCLMDANSALLVLAPLLVPIAKQFGIDAVHFGIVMVMNLEIGYLTPPVGLNLIVAMTAFKQPFSIICKAVLPFIGLMLIGLALVTFVPQISLYLVK